MGEPRCAAGEGREPDEAIDAAVTLFSALAHPVRLRVLLFLSREGPCTVAALRACTGAEASALSHQLRVLLDTRLVTRSASGRSAEYRLHDHHVAHIVEDALAHMREEPGAP